MREGERERERERREERQKHRMKRKKKNLIGLDGFMSFKHNET
jgi:hypothetical protein